MKRTTIAAFIAIAISICYSTYSQNPEPFKIKGYIIGLKEDSKIVLIDGRQKKVLDSTRVKSEHFLLTGTLAEPTQTFLYIINNGTSYKLANILLDNRIITVTGREATYDSIKVRGSVMDYQWKEWFQNDQEIGLKRNRLNSVYESLVKKNDTTNALIIKEIAESLMNERIVLLKNYVKRNYNNAAGALLPLVSNLANHLTSKDYLEMYSFLTPEIKNISLGKEVLRLIETKN